MSGRTGAKQPLTRNPFFSIVPKSPLISSGRTGGNPYSVSISSVKSKQALPCSGSQATPHEASSNPEIQVSYALDVVDYGLRVVLSSRHPSLDSGWHIWDRAAVLCPPVSSLLL